MWLVVSLTEKAVLGFYHSRDYCLDALHALEHYDPDYFNNARLVPYFVPFDEIQYFLNPVIMSCLDVHNIVLS